MLPPRSLSSVVEDLTLVSRLAVGVAWSAGSLSAREKRTAPRNTSPPPKKKEKKPEDKKQQLDSRVVPSPERDRRAGLVEPTTFVVESPSL
jgi:hypothetical protein